METVQLQCGSCMNMMAISAEHLGQQVQCPHCQAIVQTPPASAFGLAPPGPDPTVPASPSYASEPTPPIQPSEQPESIFAEAEPSDDVFNQPARTPTIHMPEENHELEPAAVAVEEAPAESEEEYEEEADLTAMRSRLASSQKPSLLGPTLMIFLVPYAICTTGFIAYLLYIWPTINTLDYLPDPGKQPRPGEKKATSINLPAHGIRLAENRKIPLGGSVQVGDIEVKPLNVWRLPKGGLEIDFIAKNHSLTNPMVPIDLDLFPPHPWKGTFRPYTFVRQQRSEGGGRRKDSAATTWPPAVLRGRSAEREGAHARRNRGRGEEGIRLATDFKSQPYIDKIKGSSYLWRIQLRRGPVRLGSGSEIPATCVIGVKFNESDIKPKS